MKLTKEKLKKLILETIEDELPQKEIDKLTDSMSTGVIENIRHAVDMGEMLDVDLKEEAIQYLLEDPDDEKLMYALDLGEELGKDPESFGLQIISKFLDRGTGQGVEMAVKLYTLLYEIEMWVAGTLSYRRYIIAKSDEILEKFMSDFPNLNLAHPEIVTNFIPWNQSLQHLGGSSYLIVRIK